MIVIPDVRYLRLLLRRRDVARVYLDAALALLVESSR